MNGTLRFRLDDEEGCVLAEVNVCFDGVEELKTAHGMVDSYLYHMEDKLERGKDAAAAETE